MHAVWKDKKIKQILSTLIEINKTWDEYENEKNRLKLGIIKISSKITVEVNKSDISTININLFINYKW